MKTNNILKEINTSGKPYVIYKTPKGFDLFTNFSKKIILSRNNIDNFLKKNNSNRKKLKKTDLYIGFFGYELLNNLIDINLPKQKSNNFPKGIFYKPETLINLNKNLIYQTQIIEKKNSKFKININKKIYTRIFDKFKKKIKKGETYQIKICTKYTNKTQIDALDFFCRLVQTNMAPEAFMIKDKDYSIISCSPENLINKKMTL